MKKKLIILLSVFTGLSMLLAACGGTTPAPAASPDPNVMSTLVAQTVEALPTQTARVEATETLEPTSEFTQNCGPVVWDDEAILCDLGVAVLGSNEDGESVLANIDAARERDFLKVTVKTEVTNKAGETLPRQALCSIDVQSRPLYYNWQTTNGTESFNIEGDESIDIVCDLSAIGMGEMKGSIPVPLPDSSLAAQLTASPTATSTPTATATP